jgi:membrane fusion protein, multidrug efflux system
MEREGPNTHRPAGWPLYVVGLLVVVGSGLLLNRLLRAQKNRVVSEVQTRSESAKAGPRVKVASVATAPPERTVTLIGEARPFRSVILYAKVSGYLKDIRVDKGDAVQAGQVVAVIESPETDHQYQAALADSKNKRLNAERARTLVKKEMIAQQDADQAETDAQVAEAQVAALATLKAYEVLRAPFSGTVTARYADPGALLQNATNAQTSALPLVTISQTDRLRVYVYPDQRDAIFIRAGDRAEISMTERPESSLQARVTRMSGELDPRTRTLLTEIDFDNRKGRILPGSFVQVSLRVRTPAYLEVPSDALVMRGPKPFVAVVTPENKINFRVVDIANDDGQQVRIVSGLKKGERIALNVGESVAEGQEIQPVSGQ